MDIDRGQGGPRLLWLRSGRRWSLRREGSSPRGPRRNTRRMIMGLVMLLALVGAVGSACSEAKSASSTSSLTLAGPQQGQGGLPGRLRSGWPSTTVTSSSTTATTENTGQGESTTTAGLAGPGEGSKGSAGTGGADSGSASTGGADTGGGGSQTTVVEEGTYSDGIYLVGTDIPSGLYKGSVNGGSGHWEISSDANGERFVAGGDPVGQFYLKVTGGEYLRLKGVRVAKASTTAADPLLASNIGDGTYRVGYDIATGWYQGTTNGSLGYWEISSDANGQELVAADYVRGPFTLKVKSGQYLTLRGVTITQ